MEAEALNSFLAVTNLASPASTESPFAQEVAEYLEQYPDTQYLDVLLTDLNGIFRGKRLPVSALDKLEAGCFFPGSVFAMDFRGNVVEAATWPPILDELSLLFPHRTNNLD